jgi:transcriptional regulator with GAF, ATPase, and Fis domain
MTADRNSGGPAEGGHPAWLCGHGHVGRDLVGEMAGALGVRDVDRPEPCGPGLVAFDGCDAGLVRLVRSVCGSGDERLIAIAVGAGVSAAAKWDLLAAGASDVLLWERPERSAEDVRARLDRWHEVDRIAESPKVRDRLVGMSAPWQRLIRQVVEVALLPEVSVLVTGQSGTGKELVARLIHDLDPRPSKGPLIILDCTTVVPSLSGSEFFGHERGAFTGAVSAREGVFASANGGVLFLDEVGELPTSLQSELLRVLQEGTYKRVGSDTWRDSRFRLICATNRDLDAELSAGTFRRDFYHRIAAWRFHLPPLVERIEDVPVLAQHFLRTFRPACEPELDDAVVEFLLARDYPGNVRDLRQLVARIAYRHVGPGPITVGDVPPDERPPAAPDATAWSNGRFEAELRRAICMGFGLKEIIRVTRDLTIGVAMAESDGNLQRASRTLGVTDRTLQLHRAADREDLRRDARPRGQSA